uniref:Exonuclease domain-containing protein n=1 Tax=Monodelphis domestica TaxID=13616 RepID=A0A5F8G2H6_MONDO
MMGFNVEKDQIMEKTCLRIDSDLPILVEDPNLILNHPDELQGSLSEWHKEHPEKSDLTKAVKESSITLKQAEDEFLFFVQQQTPPGLCPVARHSVHVDKKFLDKYMPQFMKHLHYRVIDVSTGKRTVQMLVFRKYEFEPKKAASHRVLDDSKNIEELQFIGIISLRAKQMKRRGKL